MTNNPLTRDVDDAVDRLSLHLPEAERYSSHGSPNYRVRGKTFATYVCNHHGDGGIALLVNRSLPDQVVLVENEPRYFYVPAYVGHKGWVGIHLNQGLAWERVFHELESAYMRVAPKTLVAQIIPLGKFAPPKKIPTADDLNVYLRGQPLEILQGLREVCAALPEVEEGLQFGHPAFKAGKKVFCTLHADAGITLSVWAGADMQAALTFDKRYFVPRYTGHNGWLSLNLDARLNWDEVRSLAEASYRHFALKRMVKALDESG